MPLSVTQASFTGGEWAPGLHSRVDLAKYSTAVRTMRNCYPHPHGPASNRGGTEFVAEVKDSTKAVRLLPFQFSVVQSYVLEFGNLYMRVIKDGGQVVLSSAPAAYAAGTTYAQGDHVSSGGVNYYSLVNGNVGHTPASSPTYWYALTGSIVEIKTPYVEADLALLKVEQSADVWYVTHPTYPPQKISRTAHDKWKIEVITFAASIGAPASFARSSGSGTGHTYAATALTEDGEESVVSSTATGAPGDTFGWTAVTGAASYNVYELVNGLYGLIGSAGSNSYVIATGAEPDMDVAPPTYRNPFSGAGLYPGCSAFHEQRLVFARLNNHPQTMYGTVVASFENMNTSSPLKADDAYTFTINSRQVNEIRWMVSLNDLLIGTSGGEWRMKPGANSDAITPTSVDLKAQSYWGSSDVPPLVIGNSVLFVEASGQIVRDLTYSLEVDGYAGNDLTLLSNHLFEGYTIKEWAYQQHPDSIVWAVRSDGLLLGMTYYREHQVWGWHWHDTEGDFESVASVAVTGGLNEVYFVVRRLIDGTLVRYIERFRQRLPNADIHDAYFVDCGLSLDSPVDITAATAADPVVVTAVAHGFSDGDLVDIVGVVGMTELNGVRFKVANKATDTFELQTEAGVDIDGSAYTAYVEGGVVRKAVTAISGLDHLEGRTVAVLANGNVVNGLVVTSGAITLPAAASRVHVGLGYVADLELLDFEYPTETGTAQDKIRTVKTAVVGMINTRAMWIGPSADRLLEVKFRTTEAYGEPTALFTGSKELALYAGDQREGRVFIRNVDPVPLTVTKVIGRVNHGVR